MRKRKKILCAILLVLVIGLGIAVGAVVYVVGWDNIGAAIDGLRYTQEELEGQLEQNEQKIKNAVGDLSIRDLTQEEKDALRDGTLTQEELLEQLLKPGEEQSQPQPSEPEQTEPKQPEPGTTVKPEEPKPDKPSQPQTPPGEEQAPPAEAEKSDYETRLSALIAEVYVLREEFLMKLESLLAQAKAEYKALPAEERTKSKMVPLVADYMARGTALEEECDAKIIDIVVQIETLVKENNGDPKLAETILETYAEEKRIKKAWYMAELKEKGLV